MKQPVSYSGAVLVKSGSYLFGKRSVNHSSYAGTWDIIGGHIEPGESPEDALIRECYEEAGIVPSVFQLFKVVDQTSEDPAQSFRFYIYFVTGWRGGEPVNTSTEHSALKWFSRQELNGLMLASSEYLLLIDEWEMGAVG